VVARHLGAEVIDGSAANILALAPAQPDGAKQRLAEGGFVVADGAEFGAPGVLRFAVTPGNALARALCHLA
jgi:hypothetical protein